MAVYDNTPSGEIRRAVASGAFAINGDAAKLVQAMIASVDITPAPRRLLTGSDGYERVHSALSSRLAALEAQQGIAYSADSSTSFPQA